MDTFRWYRRSEQRSQTVARATLRARLCHGGASFQDLAGFLDTRGAAAEAAAAVTEAIPRTVALLFVCIVALCTENGKTLGKCTRFVANYKSIFHVNARASAALRRCTGSLRVLAALSIDRAQLQLVWPGEGGGGKRARLMGQIRISATMDGKTGQLHLLPLGAPLEVDVEAITKEQLEQHQSFGPACTRTSAWLHSGSIRAPPADSAQLDVCIAFLDEERLELRVPAAAPCTGFEAGAATALPACALAVLSEIDAATCRCVLKLCHLEMVVCPCTQTRPQRRPPSRAQRQYAELAHAIALLTSALCALFALTEGALARGAFAGLSSEELGALIKLQRFAGAFCACLGGAGKGCAPKSIDVAKAMRLYAAFQGNRSWTVLSPLLWRTAGQPCGNV